MADDYISKGAIQQALHSGDIDMGMVSPREYRLLRKLSKRIDEVIKQIPAADVVPVVRCKDCEIQQYCKVSQHLGADGFCSNGGKVEDWQWKD